MASTPGVHEINYFALTENFQSAAEIAMSLQLL
jgi:hypothetical protein